MTKLTGNIAAALKRLAVGDNATANASAQDKAHYNRVLAKFIIPGFGKGKTVGVIIKADITREPYAQIFAQRSTAAQRFERKARA